MSEKSNIKLSVTNGKPDAGKAKPECFVIMPMSDPSSPT